MINMFCQIIFIFNLLMTMTSGESLNYPECFGDIKYEKVYDIENYEEFETVCETKYKYFQMHRIGHSK